MADKIVFVGTRGQVTDLALQLAAVLGGNSPDKHGIAVGFNMAIGLAALHDIHQAFLVKAGGGTDEMGIKWPPLSPQTVAGRRVGPRDVKRDPAVKERKKIVDREFRKLFRRLSMSLPEPKARARARQIAESRATRQTGRTKVDVLGNRVVEILRDTGVLLNSLGPGELVAHGSSPIYTKPSGDGGVEQVFDVRPGLIIVGTNVKYAGAHNYGTNKLPRRQFLPDDDSQIPQSWWENWEDAGAAALAVSARLLFEQNG